MIKWLKPSKDIIKHPLCVIRYTYLFDEDYLDEDIDIFRFDGIGNVFISRSCGHDINYSDIVAWFPLPEPDKMEN